MTERCEQMRERFSEYLDGELATEERAAIDEHVRDCPECRAELDALRETVRAVSSLPRRTAPAGLASRVVAGLRAEERHARPKAIQVLWARALPIAAMLLIVVGITFIVGREGVGRRQVDREKVAMSLDRQEPEPAEAPPAPSEVSDFAAGRGRDNAQEKASELRQIADEAAAAVGGRPVEEAVEAQVKPMAEAAAPPAQSVRTFARPAQETGRRARSAGRAQAATATVEPGIMPEPAPSAQPPGRASEATEPGLYWDAGERVREEMAETARPGGEARSAFGVSMDRRAAGVRVGQPVRLVTIRSADPQAAALRIVDAANAQGVLVSVGGPALRAHGAAGAGRGAALTGRLMGDAAPAGAPGATDADAVAERELLALAAPPQVTTLRLRVPAPRYDALMAAVRGELGQARGYRDSAAGPAVSAEAGAAAAPAGAPAREAAPLPKETEMEAKVLAREADVISGTRGADRREDAYRMEAVAEDGEVADFIELVVVIRPRQAEAVTEGPAAAPSAAAAADEPAE